MANYTVTVTGNRKTEAIKQARLAYNKANEGVEGFTPLTTQEQYVQHVIDSAVISWRKLYREKIDAALAPTEAAALAAAQAALAQAAGPEDGA